MEVTSKRKSCAPGDVYLPLEMSGRNSQQGRIIRRNNQISYDEINHYREPALSLRNPHTLSEAQNFSGRTNEIVIDYKNPSNQALVTNLPVITWQNPQQEFTNSTSESVEPQAFITSDIEIRSIQILLGDGNASREKNRGVRGGWEYKLKQHLKLWMGRM